MYTIVQCFLTLLLLIDFLKFCLEFPLLLSPSLLCMGGIVLSTGEGVCQQSPLLILQQSQGLYREPFCLSIEGEPERL
jgi:hypothetical protein